MLTCRSCFQICHLDCLHLKERETVSSALVKRHEAILTDAAANQPNAERLEQFAKVTYQCRECVRCLECGKTDAVKWSPDFNFCSSCERARHGGKFCIACLEVHDGKSPIQTCADCRRWVHNECDVALIGIEKSESKERFSCVECRTGKRTRHQRTLTDQLGNEDKKKLFFPSFWETFAPEARTAYLKQVRHKAFSFDLINERIAGGYYLNHAQGGRQLRVDLY
jgi:hypothetical protein